MADRANLIIGILLLAAVVLFVAELCSSGTVIDSSPSTDAGSSSRISVSLQDLAIEREPDAAVEQLNEPDLEEITAPPPEQTVETNETESDASSVTNETPSDERQTPTDHEPEQPLGSNDTRPLPPTEESEGENAFANQIRESFRSLRPELRECYELLLDLEPGAADRLVFELNVALDPRDDSRGQVELISISTGELVLEDVACFAEVVSEIDLPPPPEGDSYVVRYPVELSAGQ